MSYMQVKGSLDHSSCPLVTIRCTTYNHEPYVRQCLEGFVMQKTTFPFEAVVHDDASTDGTAAIIREYAEKYPDIIKPIYETENQYSKHDGSLNRILNAHMRGKYMAMCEGDDYWTDPFKLQKQVDFLEEHPDCGMCYTRVKYFSQQEKRFLYEWGKNSDSAIELLKKGNVIPTLTAVLRWNLYQEYILDVHPELRNWKMGDYPLWLWLSFHSRIKFIPDVTGVYRVLESSASHSKDVHKVIGFAKSGFDIRCFFAKKFCGNSSHVYKYITEQYILSLYWIVERYKGKIVYVKKEIDKIDFFSWKIAVIKAATRNRIIRFCLNSYFKWKNQRS